MNAAGGFGAYSISQAAYDRPTSYLAPLLGYYEQLGIFDTADTAIYETQPVPSNRTVYMPWQAMPAYYPDVNSINAPPYAAMLQQPMSQQPTLYYPAPQFAEQFFAGSYTAAPIQQPNSAEMKSVTPVYVPPKAHNTWYVSVRGAPALAEEYDFRNSFGKCGEISEVRFCQSGGFVIIGFCSKEGAIRAFYTRKFSVLNVPVTIYVEDDSLKLVLKHVPEVIEELEFYRLIDEYLLILDVKAFVYAYIIQSKAGRVIFLNFLTPDDMKSVEEVLKSQDFTTFVVQKLTSNQDFEGLESIIRCVRYYSKEERAAHHRNQQSTQLQFYVQYGSYPQYSATYQTAKPRAYGEKVEVRKTSIYLSELPFSVTKEQIEQALRHYGPIKHITVFPAKESVGKRPCATCYFDSPVPVTEALRVGSCVIAGQTAKITQHISRLK